MKGLGEKPIKNFLKDFGLTDKEITVYLTLLKSGPNTIMNLARETDIKRSTTHNTVEELIKKGLVSQTNYGERRMVVAEDPDKLKFLMDQKKWDINKMEKNLPEIVQSIYDIVPKARENTKVDVKYYQGKSEVKYVYDLILKANEVFSFADLDRYNQIFPDTFEEWNTVLTKNSKREVWDLLIDSPLSRNVAANAHQRYHVKFLPASGFFAGFDFADYIIFDNKVAIIQLDPENTLATVIDSKQISLSLIALHRSMWELIPLLSVKK